MKTDTADTKKQDALLDDLKTLLEKQVEMIKNSNLRGVESLAKQADSLVAEIATPPFPQQSRWKEKCHQVAQLYKKLTLMIEAEKNRINKQQQKIGTGKKTIRAYQNKI